MINSNSFGTNIEKILQEILVTRIKVDELLTEIRNMSTDQINRCNELVNKLLSILQVIDERTKDIENRYAKLVSEKNRFVDLTEWNETVLPEIIDIFEEELSSYLTKVLSVEDICERFLVEQLENYKAEQNDTFELTHNVFKADPANEDRMKKYVYGESIGYNWYSVKAQDDYLANDNSLLVVTEYDNDKWSELNAIYKGAVIHETISFHPKYGSLHMVTSARERVVSSYTDQETNKSFFTNDIKLFDGFDGNFNELKGSLYNRSVNRDDRSNMVQKNDIKYSLLVRHKINEQEDPMEPRDYFIMKVRDIEPLENGKPNEYVIQRINTESVSITNEYLDGTNRFNALVQNPLDKTKDSYMSENDKISENLKDESDTLTLYKKIVKINKYSYYDNNLFLNISSKGLLMLLKYQYNNNTPRVYNELAVHGLANNLCFYIKNKYSEIKNYDLLSNLVIKIMPPNYTNFTNSISYLTDFPNMEDKGSIKTFENFQIVNTSNHGLLDVLSANELTIYYKEPNTNLKIPNGTILDRMINVWGNKQYHLLTRYNMQEYYDIYDIPLRYNNYYFYPYMRNLSDSNSQNTLLNKTGGIYDTYKSQSYHMKGENEYAANMKGGFFDFELEWGYCEEFPNSDIRQFSNITKDGHVLCSFDNLYDTFYSEDYGKTWKRIVIDHENSPIKDQRIDSSNKPGFEFYNYGKIFLNENGVVVLPIYNNKTSSNKNPLYIKSTDYGKTWYVDAIETGSSSTYNNTYYINCNSDGIIFARTNYSNTNLFISTDFGKNWKRVEFYYNSSGYTIDAFRIFIISDLNPIDNKYYLGGTGIDTYRSGDTTKYYYFELSPTGLTKETIEGWSNGSRYAMGFHTHREVANLSRNSEDTGLYHHDTKCLLTPILTSNKSANCSLNIYDSHGLYSPTKITGTTVSWTGITAMYGSARVMNSGNVIWRQNSFLILDISMGTDSNFRSVKKCDIRGNVFTANDEAKIIIYQTNSDQKRINMVKYKSKRLNYVEDSEYITSLGQKLGVLSQLSTVDIDEIKERVVENVLNYYKNKSNIYIGTLIQLPFRIDTNTGYYNKYKLCDGSELSKSEYPELYKTIGDRYNDDSTESGRFKLPDFRGKTFVGTDLEENLGVYINNCLPKNMEFEIGFNRISEEDMRSGVIVSETESSNTRTSVLGGFENGMDRTKFLIDHSSQSQDTIGNMFNVDIYIRVR